MSTDWNSIYSETVSDVWTDGTYYYIPISYFETCLSSDNYPYSFDSTSTVTCPFIYVPDSSNPMASGSAEYRYQYCYYAYYAQIGDDWYLRVTDTTEGETPRADVYYSPVYRYYLYLGSVNSSSINGNDQDTNCVSSGLITDFVGYENYTLIPISYFSDHIVESSLTPTSTMTINGESCSYCTATDFEYKTTKWNAGVEKAPIFVYYNGAWYLRVQDRSTAYALPRVSIIGYTGSVGVYTTESEFYLWIYNELAQVYASAKWENGGFTVVNSIKDVISYTSPDDGKTYYYIPVSYFTSALEGTDYDYKDVSSRSLLYAPNADKTLNTTSNITTCYFADYEVIDGETYVCVQDTYGKTPHRANVYYCPKYAYNIYVGAATSEKNSVEEVTIDDYIGLGERYVLIPVSHFDNFFDESSLDSSTLTKVDDDFTGYGLELYESPFQYAADWSNTLASDAYYACYEGSWYLLVQYNCTSYSIPLRNKIWYTGKIDGIVLNLGDVNGSSAYTIYNGDSSSSTALRYTVSLHNCVDDDGNVTVYLPCDDDLGSTFTVATNGTNSATVALGSEADNYCYKLIGWINIATGEYYDVSGGSTTATVNINDYDNVFYADWIADSYDCVGDEGTIIETADTSSFVTIQMFDFSELFNVYSASLEQNGLTSEIWTDSEVFYSIPLLDNDADAENLTALGESFMFFNVSAPNSNNPGNLGLPKDRTAWNFWTGNAGQQTTYYNREYPGLYVEKIIDMLYSTDNSSSGTIGSYYVGESNYLFTYEEDSGFYSYDSATNAAVYQQSDERFYVYNSAQLYNGTTSTTFLPYNSYSSSSSTYKSGNSTINYWFGIEIELDFYLPNDTGTILSGSGSDAEYGNQINGKDMVYEFRGDDDVWVFVDDKLVLDIGGIHDAIEGTINFSTGKVTLKDKNGNEISTTSIETLLGEQIGAGTHTLTMYYMERGAGESNLKLSFNTIPEWKYESSTVGTMTAKKVWEDGDDTSIRPTYILVGLFDRVATATSTASYTAEDGTVYSFDSDGYSYDTDKLVNAYISNGYVYVRVDTETLTAEGGWTYTWTLLDSEKSEYYQILELTTLENYTTSSTSTQKTSYNTYWSIEGYDTLNGDVEVTDEGDDAEYESHTGILKNGLEIILTDGSQNGEASTSGYPTTYSGYVIDSSDGTISTTKVQFSQKATQDEENERLYTYGVTTGVPETAIWTVVMSGGIHSFITSNNVTVYAPTFYLQASNGQYLAVDKTNETAKYSLVLVDDKEKATDFSYNTLGELNTDETTGLKIEIDGNGDYVLVKGRMSDTDVKNVKIYTPTTTTIGSDYIITNTVLPSVTLKKVDATDVDKTLENVEFVMYQKDDDGAITGYYLLNDDGTVTWTTTVTDDNKLPTNEYGTITYKYLPDGTYYLKETATIDGYNNLTEELWFTISGGVVTAVGGSQYISIDDSDNLTIIVKNLPGVELPSTGSAITPLGCTIVGGIISAIAVFALMSLKRRRRN